MQWSRNVVHTSLMARMSSMHYSKNLQDGMCRAKLTVDNLAVLGTILVTILSWCTVIVFHEKTHRTVASFLLYEVLCL